MGVGVLERTVRARTQRRDSGELRGTLGGSPQTAALFAGIEAVERIRDLLGFK